METHHSPEVSQSPAFDQQQLSFWRKIGGGSLTISIIIHAVILAIGVYLVVQVIPPKEDSAVDILSNTGGGGNPGLPQSPRNIQIQSPQNTASRIAAKSAEGAFVLPEPDASSEMNSLNSLEQSSLAGGLSGNGFGPGRGDHNGPGVGNGLNAGILGGEGSSNPFGTANAQASGLTGIFYDLKQLKNGESSEIADSKDNDSSESKFNYTAREIIKEFTAKNWDEKIFEKYYRAKQELKLSRIVMPAMKANAAPKAFHCQDQVTPKRWVVLYKGAIVAPKTGKFRFVGMGDDMLMVRLNQKVVFDYGFLSFDKEARHPKLPSRHHPKLGYDKLGMAVGSDFNVQQGQICQIEILIGEIPGGRFGAFLFIEEDGVEYEKTADGFPIIPVFRTSGDLPSPNVPMPEFERNSPIWKIAEGGPIKDI